jgi:hypothetical protein
MFVSVDAFYSIVLFEVVLEKQVQDFDIDWNLTQPDEYPSRDLLHSDMVEPGMLPDV